MMKFDKSRDKKKPGAASPGFKTRPGKGGTSPAGKFNKGGKPFNKGGRDDKKRVGGRGNNPKYGWKAQNKIDGDESSSRGGGTSKKDGPQKSSFKKGGGGGKQAGGKKVFGSKINKTKGNFKGKRK